MLLVKAEKFDDKASGNCYIYYIPFSVSLSYILTYV